MLALILIAVIATDVAVAIMFLMMRRHLVAPSAGVDEALALEMEAVVSELRAQAEQAMAEISRQGAQLRRMLNDIERHQAAPPAAQSSSPAVPTPVFTPRDVLRLAGEGHSVRAIAMRVGMSVEEVRLMLAMEEAAA